MFVNLNLSKIGQNKCACVANQMICLEKLGFQGFQTRFNREVLLSGHH